MNSWWISFSLRRSSHFRCGSITVSGSSNRMADTSLRTRPRPSEIFCLASAVRPLARRSSTADSSSISAMRPTRSRICACGTPRLRSGKARLSATVIVS
ncbi:Uncharacterised protein [Bordetella pertussis]|nr:Uncharacterised protein [Bordetella pertussis]CFT98377.1 Uncharacterised protein [Bordetella pertussis]CFW07050.1 Uncharacterised protein [Bordetella pertussis]CFW29575.1 Uncharacterised protein [Bordetella pertussis]CPP21598.1 Uncharacterised protein [Bordetella pertussis]